MRAPEGKSGSTVEEWPAGLLLDEIWLRSRRLLLTQLAQRDFWLDATSYRSVMGEQLALGKSLRDTTLRAFLGSALMPLLESESLFGAANRRFRTRLPLCLAFGYEIGRGLAAIAPDAGSGESRCALELAALFNLGISTFDLLHDSMPAAVEAFSSRFDARLLAQLHGQQSAAADVAAIASSAELPEIRLLLQIIASFYIGLHTLADGTSAEEPKALLTAAYGAEMSSTQTKGASAAARLRISRQKSALPFRIIGELVRLGRESRPDVRPLLDSLAENLGELFWLVDDLADVVDDLACDAMNGVAARAVLRGRAGDTASVAWRLVQSKAIETSVRSIGAAVESILRISNDARLAGTTTAAFPTVIAAYVRNWIE